MSAVVFPGAVRTGRVARRRARVARKSRSISLAGIAVFLLGVAFLSFVFTQLFNLAGILQVEKFRVASQVAESRAAAAESGALELRLQVERLQRSNSVERWAAVNGFVPSYAVSNEANSNY